MIKNPSAIIADDEQHLANFLQDRLSALWPELLIAGIAKNGHEVLKLVAQATPSVVFLDIRMPGLSGLEVAALLDAKIYVVFVTAFDQYAVEAFDRQALDYLLKPVTDERLSRTISRLKEKIVKSASPGDIAGVLKYLSATLPPVSNQYLRWIRATAGDAVRQIPVADVYYLQARDKYVSVYTKEGESLLRTSLSELLAQLDPNEFWQIYRSIVINVNRVVSTHRDTMSHMQLTLKDCNTKLPVSRAYEHLFKQM